MSGFTETVKAVTTKVENFVVAYPKMVLVIYVVSLVLAVKYL